MAEQRRFENHELVLRVSKSVDPSVFDINKYENFIDVICGDREYQKEAIKTALRYLVGGRYVNLKQLAEENFDSNSKLQDLFGSFQEMKKNLQFPDQLSCTIDLATGTGKSYIIYGIARIMLAEGLVDHVLVVCPSTTIENGLMDKFRILSADEALRDLLPENSIIRNPHIINANESITKGTICIENCHALYEHVSSSIRDSLLGKGKRTLVINDETHHVFNQAGADFKKWKEFLLDQDYGFRYIVGLSGTCYINDSYFSDVISRYSLRQAIEEGFVKGMEYVAEDSSINEDEKFQKIYDNHLENKLKYRLVKPLTILVTKDIIACNKLTEDLTNYLCERENLSFKDVAKKISQVTSSPKDKGNVLKLSEVDRADNPIEWITSVSMLTEGWDVKNVFQIVPHEERAFNSKLLIAQVLGRGMRVPLEYLGQKPVVIVFNHDRWSGRIKQLVNEVLEIEKKIYSYPVTKDNDYNFNIHRIDFDKLTETEDLIQKKEYEFTKGYVTLIRQAPTLARATEYTRVLTGQTRVKKTVINYKMFTIDEVAEQISNRLKSIDIETTDSESPTNYADKYSLDWIKSLILNSLQRIGETGNIVSEENRQRIYSAFLGILTRPARTVRYKMSPKAITLVNTSSRRKNGAGIGSIKRAEVTIFWDENSKKHCQKEDINYINDLEKQRDELPGGAIHEVSNVFNFKTPLGLVIADHKPERLFVRELIKDENSKCVDSWIKAPDQDFYPIEYSWKKGTKRRSFNPDFFIKIGNTLLVVEIKGDEEIREPSDENKAKYKYARKHFELLNKQQDETTYYFNFLTPEDYDFYFSQLRSRNFYFTSKLDAELEKNGID